MRYFIVISFLLLSKLTLAQSEFEFNNADKLFKIGLHTAYLEDKDDAYTLGQIQQLKFTANNKEVLNFQFSESAYWIKFKIKNNTNESAVLEVDHPTIDFIKLYIPDSTGRYKTVKNTEKNKFGDRLFDYQSYIFDLHLDKGETKEYYLKVKASEQFLVPITVATKKKVLENNTTKDLIFGIYVGIMLVMVVYNLFIFFSVKDFSYLYYVAYIIFVTLTQVTLQGYGFRFIWPNFPQFNNYSTVLIPFINGITALEFFRHFLNIRKNSQRINKLTNYIEAIYCLSVILCLLNYFVFAQLAAQATAAVASVFVIAGSAVLSRKIRSARFFLIAWAIFISTVLIFVMRNFNLLPYNAITYYALQVGSAIEVALLSFALADKINIYRDEKELSQKEALLALQENERLIKEQNVVLESKVKERTEELENANSTLNVTLNNLKETQSQLVDAEKMAALGQLTAGIAHEINNPINFVTANIKPLELDINDLKEIITKYESIDLTKDLTPQLDDIELFKRQIDLPFVNTEITSLLGGISEGAKRTAEIIKSLRNFSRLDEDDMKPVDLNEGLQSTLVLVKNNLPENLKVIKDLANLPMVECMPGKINQVFMNLVSNAIQAIKAKEIQNETEFLTIKSWFSGEQVFISVKDTGIGMTEDVKHRIFEPFFTTKDIGQGTGLGLSIVFSIIEKHKGHIDVKSNWGEGTEFIITLQIKP